MPLPVQDERMASASSQRSRAAAADVYLTDPDAAARSEFVALARASRALHGRFVQAPDTPSAFAKYLQRCAADDYQARWLRRSSDDALVGVFNISQIVAGCFQSAYLGYYAFAAHAGQGLMSVGLRLLLREIFGRSPRRSKALRLHRIEANIQPDNTASIALVQRCGFRKEGYSPRYLKIAGRWRDHERWALLQEDFRSGAVASHRRSDAR